VGITLHLLILATIEPSVADQSSATSWWTDDRSLAFVGFLLTIVGIFIAVLIYFEQKESQKLFSRKVLGSVPGIDQFRERVCTLLRHAERDPDSRVVLMLYWLWFGADRLYPMIPIQEISEQNIELIKLIKGRIAKQLKTTIVFYDVDLSKRKIQDFLRDALEYNRLQAYEESGMEAPQVSEHEVVALFERYEASVQQVIDLAKGCPNAVVVSGKEEVSALMCASEGDQSTALVLLFEIDAIRARVTAGGFESEEPRMIQVVREQVEAAAKAST